MHDDTPRLPPTQEELLRRIDVMNQKILEWTKRPHPVFTPSVRPKKRASAYYAGRVINTAQAIDALGVLWNVQDMQVIFLRSLMYVSPALTDEGIEMVARTVIDFEQGAELPCFVSMAYLKLIKGI